jgi:hypothetical protein
MFRDGSRRGMMLAMSPSSKEGCAGTATAPIVTPFNGVQHAGIQILNTSQFHGLGPLSHVKA